MSDTHHFAVQPLRDMVAVGRIGPHSVRLWLRSELGGTVHVSWWPLEQAAAERTVTIEIPHDMDADHTMGVELPGPHGVEEPGEPLQPLTRYGFRAHDSGGHLLGTGRFETAPATAGETPQRFSIALASCHQPFDRRGAVEPDADAMLRAVPACLEQHETRLVFLVGDQMYMDFPRALSLLDDDHLRSVGPPGRRSLFECSEAEVRRIYQDRYRRFWNHGGWRTLQANWPCYTIPDDHDLVDNWGSREEHQHAPWSTIGAGARAACFDYQMRRILSDRHPPPSFHYEAVYGHTAAFVMDLRSERRAGPGGGHVCSEQQERTVAEFLERHADKRVLLLVLSVPLLHLPRWVAKTMSWLPFSGESFADRWSAAEHADDRGRLLRIIAGHQRRNPEQLVMLLSGDIHCGSFQQIRWRDGTPPLYQAVSSPITHRTNPLMKLVSATTIRAMHKLGSEGGELQADVEMIPAGAAAQSNPYAGLNIGIVEIETPAPDALPWVRYYLYGHEQGRPKQVFASRPIRAISGGGRGGAGRPG